MTLPVSFQKTLASATYRSNPASEKGFQAGPFQRRVESSPIKQSQTIGLPHHNVPLAVTQSRQLGSRT